MPDLITLEQFVP